MKIECPVCGKKYEIPERHLGRRFRCLKCKKKIRTPESASLVPYVFENADSRLGQSDLGPSNLGESNPKLARFKKEQGPADTSLFKGLKVFSVVLFGVGVLAILLMIVESRYGFMRQAQLDIEGIQTEAPVDDVVENSELKSDPLLKKPQNATGSISSAEGVPVAAAGKSETTSQSRTPVTRPPGDEAVDALPMMLPLNEPFGQQPLLGEIEDFDPTWFTNNANYSLRILTQNPVDGARVEKVARAYGSPTFIDQYRRLQESSNFSVRFYSSLGLANFGFNLDESLLVMLEAIATNRTRVGTTKLRLDLANQLLAVHHERVPQALYVMARRLVLVMLHKSVLLLLLLLVVLLLVVLLN